MNDKNQAWKFFGGKPRCFIALVSCLAGALFTQPVVAAASMGTPNDIQSLEGTQTITFPLAHFMAENRTLRLQSASSEYSLSIPVAPREEFVSLTLHLDITNSISLIGERSQLAVYLNDRVLVQLPLSPKQPETRADIRIPVSLLKPGYNRLSFRTAQHYTLRCEDPSAPELWTEINSDTSTLTAEIRKKPVIARLSRMADLWDPKQWLLPSLAIVTAGAPDDRHLNWGGLIAQAAGVHLQFIPPNLYHRIATSDRPSGRNFEAVIGERIPKNADAVLVGTRRELSALMGADFPVEMQGGYLGLYALGEKRERFLLVVSGETPEQVDKASQALSVMAALLPDSQASLVQQVLPPTLPDRAAEHSILPGHTYRFADFGFHTATKLELMGRPFEFSLNLPADTYAAEDAMVELSLRFAYGAAAREDSVLNVMLNNRFENVIRLNDEDGAVYRNYKLTIPLRSFKPGHNVIALEPQMMPLVTGECLAINYNNLRLTLFDDSTLKMPSAANFTRLPNLMLFSRTGFPYAVSGNGSDTYLLVGGKDSQTTAASWMLLAKVAQRRGYPLLDLRLGYKADAPDLLGRNVLAVGALPKLDSQILQGSPFERSDSVTFQYAMNLVDQGGAAVSWLERVRYFFGVGIESGAPYRGPVTTQVTQKSDHSGLGNLSLAVQYRSPWGGGKTATVFTAADGVTLRDGMARLVQPDLWDNLNGEVAIWRANSDTMDWHAASTLYEVGSVGMWYRLSYYLSGYPWWWYLSTLFFIGVLAWLAYALLKRFRQRHHPDAHDQ